MKKKLSALGMKKAYDQTDQHLCNLEKSLGVENALKGALINIIQAIYSSAPSLEEARHTIEVALNMSEDLVAKVEDPECPKCNSKIRKH